jgi:hypothetical protein
MRKLLAAITLVTVTLFGTLIASTAESAQARPVPLHNSGYFTGEDFTGSEHEYGYWERNYAGSICLNLDFMELCYREENPRYNDEWRKQQRRRQQYLQREEQRRARELQLRRRLDQLYRDFPELKGVPPSPNDYWLGPHGDVYDNRGVLVCRAGQICVLQH